MMLKEPVILLPRQYGNEVDDKEFCQSYIIIQISSKCTSVFFYLMYFEDEIIYAENNFNLCKKSFFFWSCSRLVLT